MMMSLFSMFDPTAFFMIQMNWILFILSSLVFPILYWKSLSRSNLIMMNILNSLNKEFFSLFSKNILFKGTTLIMISLFLIIMINNLTSNYPYNFCCSSHLNISISLSLPIWLSIILSFWMNLTTTMFAHLVPSGTPTILMPLMVMIELTSNLIRPMALAVRLTANLIAGHLLMALLGNTLDFNSMLWVFTLIIQSMFLLFELVIAIIQGYVFSVLMTLYSSEIS